MQNDDDLRTRFHALAAEEGPDAPAFKRPIVYPQRTWRLGMIAGLAAGAVVMLTIGLVLGTSTGYASAEVILRERGETLAVRPALAVLKNIPPLIFSCGEPPRVAALPPKQQGVPIVDLPAATARSAEPLGGVLGIHVLSNGNVIVDDGGRRQVKLFDSTLSRAEVVRDSTPGTSTSYGPRALPLARYLGDSSLMTDYQGQTIAIIGPTGQVARIMAPLSMDMLIGTKDVDDKGRILFAGFIKEDPMLGLERAKIPDSVLVLRADLDARRIDTLARIKSTGVRKLMGRVGDGPVRVSQEPVALLDDWARLSDGSIAIVRGRDYHVDWIRADGSTHSTPKLPFDWKPLTLEEKQHAIDSVRALVTARPMMLRPAPTSDEPPARPGGRTAGASDPTATIPVPIEYIPPPLEQIFDFHPPLRRGALWPDLDGNLWILPTTSAQSKQGELVYDVVNVKGDFHRVRVPLGRSVVGFGKGGVVFLLSGDKTTGFYLEKTKLPALNKTLR
jgi:hypothetical protein